MTPRPQKKRRGEEEDDSDFDPKGETQGPRVPSPDQDTKTPRLEVLASHDTTINTILNVCIIIGTFCPRQLPVVPRALDFDVEEEQERDTVPPLPPW